MLLWIAIRQIHISEQIKWIVGSFPFIAACFDYIENVSMLTTLNTFPIINFTIVHIGSIATNCKNIFSIV
jgi:hypothetical protein